MKKIIQKCKALRTEWQQNTGFRPERVLLICVILAFILSRQPLCDLLFSIPIEALIGITAAVLAIAIPLAILMIDSNSSETKFVLDQQVGIEKVFNAPLLITALIVMIIPSFLFWNYSYGQPSLRSFLLVWFGLGIFLLIISMRSVYIWLSSTEIEGADNDINRKRLEYLETIPASKKKEVWPTVWRDAQGRRLIGDERLMQKFFKYLESLTRDNGKDEKYKGMAVSQQFIQQFKTFDLQNPNIYEQLINFAIQGANITTSDGGTNPYYATFAGTPHTLFCKIINKSLSNNSLSYMFFNNIEKFPWAEQDVDQKAFIKTMTYDFFRNMEGQDRSYGYSTVWEQFPKIWTITAQNLKGKNNLFAQGWLQQYLKWVIDRCYVGKGQDDKTKIDDMAENVTRHLLPKIDPVTWSTLLTFQLVPMEKNLNDKEAVRIRMQGFIQGAEQFGFISSSFLTTVTNIEDMRKAHEKEMKKQQEEVFQINKITGICPILLDIRKIDEYLTVAEQLKDYKAESREEYRRMRIIRILNAAKQWLLKLED